MQPAGKTGTDPAADHTPPRSPRPAQHPACPGMRRSARNRIRLVRSGRDPKCASSGRHDPPAPCAAARSSADHPGPRRGADGTRRTPRSPTASGSPSPPSTRSPRSATPRRCRPAPTPAAAARPRTGPRLPAAPATTPRRADRGTRTNPADHGHRPSPCSVSARPHADATRTPRPAPPPPNPDRPESTTADRRTASPPAAPAAQDSSQTPKITSPQRISRHPEPRVVYIVDGLSRASDNHRDPEASGQFLRGGARPPTQEVVAFIDANRDEFGVEPICTVLRSAGVQVAPSTYYAAKTRAPSARARRDAVMGPVLIQLWKDNYRVYGARKLWKTARRAGHDLGRDQVAPADAGGRHRRCAPRQTGPHHQTRPRCASRHPDLVGPRLHRDCAQPAVGHRSDVRADLGRRGLRLLHRRCLQPDDRRLAGRRRICAPRWCSTPSRWPAGHAEIRCRA